MKTDALGYYQILGCDARTDDHLLKISYRDRAKLWHPDHNKAENALEQFQKISSAYNILSNPKTRFVYDLLSFAYGAKDFPDMATLKIYKSVSGQETPFLRVFKLTKLTADGIRCKVEEQNLVGTFADAEKFIRQITTHNWLRGWQHFRLLSVFPKALRGNFQNINANRSDNFKMLVHNAAAFYAEDKTDKAYLSLVQALVYADADEAAILQTYLSRLPVISTEIPTWNFRHLRQIQLFVPKMLAAVFGMACLVGGLVALGGLKWTGLEEKMNYYRQVRFLNGSSTVDDIAVSKIYNIPVDTTDTKMLYYLTDRADVMYGPGEKFDKMTTLGLRHTVRLTGYTVDKEWFRVMLDNGETGFVKKGYLKAGIGREIPEDSKIFEAPK